MRLSEKERLLRALNKEPIDRQPCICPGGMMNMVTTELMQTCGSFWPEAHSDPRLMSKLALAAHKEQFFENYGLPFCMTVEAEAMGAKVDLGSEIYEPHVIEYAIRTVSDWQQLLRIDCSGGRARVVLEAIALLKEQKNGVPIVGNITGPMSVASNVLDPIILYKELRRKADDSLQLMNFIAEELLAFALLQVEAGADVITISDPSGTGEILGPELFKKFMVPALNRIVEGVRARYSNVGTVVHICGKMHKVLPILPAISCQALSFDALVNMRRARQTLPTKVLMGNVSTFAVGSGTPERVSRIARFCLKCGVDIISPACGLGTSSPSANVKAILQAVKESAPTKQT